MNTLISSAQHILMMCWFTPMGLMPNTKSMCKKPSPNSLKQDSIWTSASMNLNAKRPNTWGSLYKLERVYRWTQRR